MCELYVSMPPADTVFFARGYRSGLPRSEKDALVQRYLLTIEFFSFYEICIKSETNAQGEN